MAIGQLRLLGRVRVQQMVLRQLIHWVALHQIQRSSEGNISSCRSGGVRQVGRMRGRLERVRIDSIMQGRVSMLEDGVQRMMRLLERILRARGKGVERL